MKKTSLAAIFLLGAAAYGLNAATPPLASEWREHLSVPADRKSVV